MIRNAVSIAVLFSASVFAVSVDEILDKMEENENYRTSRVEMTQITVMTGGRENVSRLISYSMDDGDKGLMEYVSPARIKGMKILLLNGGDDIWFYSPRTARVRKIASHQKNQSINNSDFSYEDLSAKDRREEYRCTLIGTGRKNDIACYTIEMIPKKKTGSYSKAVMWIDKEKYVPVEGHFFDENGELWKKLLIVHVEKVGKYWTMNNIEMRNVFKGSKTIMNMEKIEYDQELDPAMFTERYLKQ
ncbi:MAG: outer membrane lipoprotein-sorting protein [Chitinispirillaceae bacterium]|nr:outer membrane lipoprotein-sorting protein [Chitinispirillaceae bacterium]